MSKVIKHRLSLVVAVAEHKLFAIVAKLVIGEVEVPASAAEVSSRCQDVVSKVS